MGVIGTDYINRNTISLTAEQRLRHFYIIGQTGTGKSTFLKNQIVQDIGSQPFALFDPHGDLAEEILALFPPHLTDKVIYFNPQDTERPFGFNPLEDNSPKTAQSIIHAMKGIWGDTWGEGRMQYVFINCLLALIEAEGHTLLSINRFLSNKTFRQEVLNKVKDPVIREYWLTSFPKFKLYEQALITSPIENKVGQFIVDPMIRNIVGQKRSTINIPEIINGGYYFIANLSKGQIGQHNSNLLGSLLVAGFEIAALERQGDRKDYFLYIDEFQNMTTESFESILSEARKYRLGLVLAHQYADQLSRDLQSAVFGNVGNMLIYRIGAGDAERIAREFDIEVEQLTDLPRFQGYFREEGGYARRIKISKPSGEKFDNHIVEQSRQRYGRDKNEIERKLGEWYK